MVPQGQRPEGEPGDRPDIITLIPVDPATVTDAMQRAARVTRARADQAGTVPPTPRELTNQRQRVDKAADDATGAEQRADDAVGESQRAVDRREDAALALVAHCRACLADPATARPAGGIELAQARSVAAARLRRRGLRVSWSSN